MGLMAELKYTISREILKPVVKFKVVKYVKRYIAELVPQDTPKITLTVRTIKVTRFRSFIAPCLVSQMLCMFDLNHHVKIK